jgi:hypothetical protein
MGRRREKQVRIGASEKKVVASLVRKIKGYRVFRGMRNQRETSFNDRLMDHLRQNPNPLDVINKNIPVATFVGEQFRPEFYVKHHGRQLCCVECKRLTQNDAKGRWKAGLSQALLYSAVYKAVVLVLFDFTRDSRYFKKFGPGNAVESRFAAQLRRDYNIFISVVRAE